MKPLFRLALCAVFSLFSIPAAAGPITGRVVDPADRGVPNALVVLLSGGLPVRSVFTNQLGEFKLDTPDTGKHELRIALQGFRSEPVWLTGTAAPQDLGAVRIAVSAFSEAIVVSASQVEIPLSEAPATVTVISGAELEARQLHSVADALRTVPGLTVISAGGTGAVTGVFPRGGESNYTLVFVDDVPVNAFGGEFDFAHLSTVNVERIEVVRGAQSALFGANAIGGVVRIVTRRGGEPQVAGTVEAGGYDTFRMAAATSGSRGAFDWGASGERLSSDGFSGRRTAAGLTVTNDDYERTSGAFSAGWRLGDASLRGHVRHAVDDRGAPGPFGTNPIGAFTAIDESSRNSNAHTLVSASAAFPVSPRIRAVLLTAFHRLDSDFLSPFGPSEASSRRWSGRAQTDFTLTKSLALSAGLELQRERAGSTYITGARFQPIPIERSIEGYFAEARWHADGRLLVTGGVRLENIRRPRLEESPDEFSPRPVLDADSIVSVNPKASVSWVLRPGENATRLRGAAGTGIRPPSGFDLAFTDNPALRPERSFSTEAAIEQAFAGGLARVEAVAFFNEYDDLIVAVGSFRESSRYRTDNISNARSRGLELGLTARRRLGSRRPVDVQGRIGYTLLDTEILAVDNGDDAPPPFVVGDPLIRQPRHGFTTDLSMTAGSLSAFVSGGGRTRTLDVEPSFGTFGGLFYASGFQAWNAGASWRLGFGEVFGRVENLFDRSYEEALGFPALGRRATVGLRIAAGR